MSSGVFTYDDTGASSIHLLLDRIFVFRGKANFCAHLDEPTGYCRPVAKTFLTPTLLSAHSERLSAAKSVIQISVFETTKPRVSSQPQLPAPNGLKFPGI